MRISNIIIGMFIVITSAIVGLCATVSMVEGVQGMGYVLVGCMACFIGGWAAIAVEFDSED